MRLYDATAKYVSRLQQASVPSQSDESIVSSAHAPLQAAQSSSRSRVTKKRSRSLLNESDSPTVTVN